MPISVTNIGTNSNISGATIAISSVSVPAGALIFVATDENSNTIGGSVADGTNGAYTAGTGQLNSGGAGGGFGRYFYFPGSAALSSATITYTKQSSIDSGVVSAFYATGVLASSPLDSAVSATSTGSSTGPSAFVSGTPSVSGELFVAVLTTSSGVTYTQDTANGWAAPPTDVTSGSSSRATGGSQVNAGTGTIAFAGSLAFSEPWAAWIVGFKPIPVSSVFPFVPAFI